MALGSARLITAHLPLFRRRYGAMAGFRNWNFVENGLGDWSVE